VTRLVLDGRTATDHFPGIGRYVASLAQALRYVAPNLNLSLLTDPSATATRLILPDLPHMACRASPFSVRQQWAVPRELRRVHAALYHSPYYLMPYRAGVPAVVTMHDLIPAKFPAYFAPAQRLTFALTVRLAAHAARMVIAVSQTTASDLQRLLRLAEERVAVILEAADPAFRPQPPEVVAALRARLGLPETYVLYLGSNKPHKNLVRLVEAWARCQPQSLPLVVAGVWDSRYPQVRQKADELALGDKIRFLGPVVEPNLPALYSGATLFTLPSEYEGFGLPALEALACGVPVACSNTSSLPEVVGDAALTFDPTNIDTIADALCRLLADGELRAELRMRGLRRAAQFSWERTAQETLAVYRQVTAAF
jgi:glycosyltransferase involved in cell wall biosynthesis